MKELIENRTKMKNIFKKNCKCYGKISCKFWWNHTAKKFKKIWSIFFLNYENILNNFLEVFLINVKKILSKVGKFSGKVLKYFRVEYIKYEGYSKSKNPFAA